MPGKVLCSSKAPRPCPHCEPCSHGSGCFAMVVPPREGWRAPAHSSGAHPAHIIEAECMREMAYSSETTWLHGVSVRPRASAMCLRKVRDPVPKNQIAQLFQGCHGTVSDWLVFLSLFFQTTPSGGFRRHIPACLFKCYRMTQ